MGSDTWYEILGVPPAASTEEIKARYRNLILRIHPDVDGPVALFRQVQQAYEVLSDPVRRASYDQLLHARVGAVSMDGDAGAVHRGPGYGSPRPARSSASAQRAMSKKRRAFASSPSRHPARPIALVGVILLVFGAAFAQFGTALILLGLAALVVAGVAGLGARGAKEREAYRRSGITAVDAMTGRQFGVLLEHFFVNKGYRVARIGGRRGDSGARLLLNNAHGRVIVDTRRLTNVVHPDAVQEAIAARDHYGATRALVVTSSDYSHDAVTDRELPRCHVVEQGDADGRTHQLSWRARSTWCQAALL